MADDKGKDEKKERSEVGRGLVRAGVDELTDLAREPLVNALLEDFGANNKPVKKLVGAFLNTRVGSGAFRWGLGKIIPMMSEFVPVVARPYLLEVAEEMRVGGYQKAFAPVLKALKDPLVRFISRQIGVKGELISGGGTEGIFESMAQAATAPVSR